jgi:hypothetical protein
MRYVVQRQCGEFIGTVCECGFKSDAEFIAEQIVVHEKVMARVLEIREETTIGPMLEPKKKKRGTP